MVDRNDSFLREVNEEIRRERLTKLWERFGTFIIAGVVLLIGGVAAYKWNEARQIAAEQRTGARFEAASRLAAERKTDEAMAAFAAIAKDGPAGYGALARMRIAGEHAKAGRTADALSAYEALSGDSAADELLRDFAALQAAMLRLDQADWTEMKNRLTPLVGDQRPWRAQAREVLGLAALKAGQTDEATKLFEQILGDRATTGGLSRRAQEMLAVLTDRAAAKSAAQGQAPAPQDAKGKNGEPAAKN
jgi:hypothetical protein